MYLMRGFKYKCIFLLKSTYRPFTFHKTEHAVVEEGDNILTDVPNDVLNDVPNVNQSVL